MHKYQMVIYKIGTHEIDGVNSTKNIYELNSAEEIMLGLSLELIMKTGVYFSYKNEVSSLDRATPYKLERHYISAIESIWLVRHLKEEIALRTLRDIDSLIGLGSRINIEIKVNEFKIVTKPTDLKDIKGAVQILNEYSGLLPNLKKVTTELKSKETVRVDYSEQLENSGLLTKDAVL